MASFCFVLLFVGSLMTVKYGPGANGSGMAELMAYLNGVNYPKLIGIDTLITKSLCVVLGIAGGLCIGKEGPLAHIGAIVAVAVIHYIPIPAFDYFKNDVSKREFICGGISAGVSAAFGAPIGGTLFSYELSKPTTFWTFSMLWRTFFCCCCSTFMLSFLT
jgi:H+/Cl- antiporter ClcA